MKNPFKKCILPLVLSAVLLCGCGGGGAGKTEEGSGAQETEDSGAQKTESTAGAEEDASGAQAVFEGKDMEGNRVSSDDFSKSKLTMINVWATYCSPCLNEMPELGELAQEYDPEDFQIIGIVSNVPEGADEESLELVEVLIEQTSAAYPHVLLNESLLDGMLADVTGVPTTFFYNQEGKLLDTVVGAKDKAAWKEIIDGLIEE